jgi:hypothetical protein
MGVIDSAVLGQRLDCHRGQWREEQAGPLPFGEFDAGQRQDFIGSELPGHCPAAVSLVVSGTRCRCVVFVDDIADELLHQVFEGDQPGCAAVLVGYDGQLQPSLLEEA